MKTHIIGFLKFWGYDICDINEICCWYCNSNQGVTIMHIDQKGMGGRESAEYPENYMPGCHKCHKLGEGNAEWKVKFWLVLCERIRIKKPDHIWSDYFKLTSFYKNYIENKPKKV